MKIGVIGLGFVGQATYEGLRPYYDVKWCDKSTNPMGLQRATDEEQTTKDKIDLPSMLDRDIVFICVPTPMDADGAANIGIVESVLVDLEYSIHDDVRPLPVLVIKSTVPPGTTAMLAYKYKSFPVLFNPEFLTEANYLVDFATQDHIIIGGERPATGIVKQMYTLPFPEAKIIKTDSTYAELVKYMKNCFLATKVSFANDMKRICDHYDVDYDKIVEYATYDDRLGKSHWNVPGPDGRLGFGGTCVLPETNVLEYEDPDLRITKFIKDMSVGDEVVSVDDSISKIEVKKVLGKTTRHYSGEMIKFTVNDKEFICTENHIIPVYRDGAILRIMAKDVCLTDELYMYIKE